MATHCQENQGDAAKVGENVSRNKAEPRGKRKQKEKERKNRT